MSDETSPLKGKRYSHLYLPRPEHISDSPIIRKRIAYFFRLVRPFDDTPSKDDDRMKLEITSQLGARFLPSEIVTFFRDANIEHVLDAITLIWTYFRKYGTHSPQTNAATWRDGVENIFREEGAAYTVDEFGGVHPYVDAEFQRARHSSILMLTLPRYVAAASSFEKAYDCLKGSPASARDAVKHAFDAAETVFKSMTKRNSLKGADAIILLKPKIDKLYSSSDPIAQRASHQMLASFAAWADACHNYRHAPAAGESPEPPEAVWQLLLTQAAGFIRWLVQIDTATTPEN